MKRNFARLTLIAVVVFHIGPAFAQEAQPWGTIKGRIIWNGNNVPPPAVIEIPAGNGAAPGCLQANNNKMPPDETWVVHQKNKGIKNTFVWLIPTGKNPLPIHPDLKEIKVKKIEIDQPACHFIPHALALRQGQTLVVKNSAPFVHSFKCNGSQPANMRSEAIQSGAQISIDFVADRLPIAIDCAIHPWMRGWIRVFDHPYYAVTDENGAFEIKNAPAGNFRLMVWHASSGWNRGKEGRNGDPVQIQPGQVTDLGNIAFVLPKN